MTHGCMTPGCTGDVDAPQELIAAAVLLLCDGCRAARARELLDQRVRVVGVEPTLAHFTLAQVDHPHGLEAGMKLVRRWVAGETALARLVGPVGVGKTRLAIAAANMLASRGKRVRFYSTATLGRDLSREFGHPDRERAIDALAGRCALVLDDIENIGTSLHAATQVYAAINERVDGAAPLLVTSNLTLGEIEEHWAMSSPLMGQRIASRLCLLEWAQLDGPDRRRLAAAGAAHG